MGKAPAGRNRQPDKRRRPGDRTARARRGQQQCARQVSTLPWVNQAPPTSGSPGGPGPDDGMDEAAEDGETRDDSSHEMDLHLDLHKRMVPAGAKRVFVSQDCKELHYLVPVRRVRNYHVGYRDFIVVGFRLLRCSNSEHANPGYTDAVVGWCNAERHCREPPFRRATFSDSDMDFSSDKTGYGALCDCAKQLYDCLGGHAMIRLHFLAQDTTVQFERDGTPRLMGEWRVARHVYDIVNLNQRYDLVFNQWGVSRLTNEGWYSCMMCVSKPRHCAHNKALLGINEGEGTGPGLSRVGASERSISSLLDADKTLKPPCISKLKLPFFPNEDADVEKQYTGQ